MLALHSLLSSSVFSSAQDSLPKTAHLLLAPPRLRQPAPLPQLPSLPPPKSPPPKLPSPHPTGKPPKPNSIRTSPPIPLTRAPSLTPATSPTRKIVSDDAAALYRRAIAADPNSFEAHISLGLLLARQNKLAEARPELLTATTLDPGLADPTLKARAWRALARIDRDSESRRTPQTTCFKLSSSRRKRPPTRCSPPISPKEPASLKPPQPPIAASSIKSPIPHRPTPASLTC